MNKSIIIGHLTRDPELRYTQSGMAFVRFFVAVNRMNRKKAEQSGQPGADFIPCVAWDKRAELIGNYFVKGSRIGITGHIQTGSYEAKDGSKRNTFDVVVEEVDFLDSRKESEGGHQDYDVGEPIPDSQIPF